MIVGKLEFPIHVLVVSVVPSGRYSIVIERVQSDKEQLFDSYRSLLLKAFNVLEVSEEQAKDDIFFARILHQSNLIKAKTMRGSGNIVTVSPNTRFDIETIKTKLRHDPFLFETTDALKDDELMIYYDSRKSTCFDAPFVAEILPTGEVKAFLRENSHNLVSNSTDFGVIIRIV